MRQLTTRFGTYKLAKFEKATGKGVMDLLDIGNLEVNKIAQIIKLGNTFGPGVDEDEEAYKKLDDYLASDPDNSIITAFFDLLDELDKDLKILKSCGLNVEDIKKEFMDKAKQGINFGELETVKKYQESIDNKLEETIETYDNVVKPKFNE